LRTQQDTAFSTYQDKTVEMERQLEISWLYLMLVVISLAVETSSGKLNITLFKREQYASFFLLIIHFSLEVTLSSIS
jgi:amino acid permease